MKKLTLTLILLVVIVVSIMFLILINNKAIPKIYQVSITNYQFSLSELIIKKGDTIIWTNTDDIVHTITPNQNDNLENNVLSKGQTFSHTFHTPGTYRYHCDDHLNMTGIIIVE